MGTDGKANVKPLRFTSTGAPAGSLFPPQQDRDLWQAMRSEAAAEIDKLEPLDRAV
jgi:hypothetical protein